MRGAIKKRPRDDRHVWGEDCAGRRILREFRPGFRSLIYPAGPQAVKNSSRENGLDVVSHSLIGCRCEEEPG